MAKIAFLFSGQGAQYPGMGLELYESSKSARAVFDMAESVRPGTIDQCFCSDTETLKKTVNTQPCLFAVDLACAAALCEAGASADGAAGFSLGEVAAAAFCGILTYEDAFKIVVKRGELMEECSERHPGAMSAILKLSPECVDKLAQKFDRIYPVNYNSDAQTVVSGDPDRLVEFEAAVKSAGGRAIRLKVGGAFHSPFMQSAADGLYTYMQSFSFSSPSIPLYSNTTALPYGKDAADILAQQIKSPVRWSSTIKNMLLDGFDTFIEVGAGKTLFDLCRKIGCGEKTAHVENISTLAETLKMLNGETK